MPNVFPFPSADAVMIAREFPDYDVSTLPTTMPRGFTCGAWHNDVCPLWYEGETSREPMAGDLMIAIDYPDPAMREFVDVKTTRYSTSIHDQHHNWEPLIDSDDWARIEVMVAYVRFVRTLGLGFHVDTRGRDYVFDDTNGRRVFSDDEADRYDAVVEAVHRICDPYEVAIKVWNVMGFGFQ